MNMKCTGTEKKPENPPLIRRRRRSNPNHISKDLKDWIGLLDLIGLDWIVITHCPPDQHLDNYPDPTFANLIEMRSYRIS